MILILPGRGITVIPSLSKTVFKQLAAEVPAARPLAEVTPQGSHIADLGNRYLASRLGKKGISSGTRGEDAMSLRLVVAPIFNPFFCSMI